MKKIKLLLAALAAIVSLGVQAGSDWVVPSAPSASDPVSGQTYKIRNVGAGQYLTGASVWYSWATSTALTNLNSSLTFTLSGDNTNGWTIARTSDNKLTFISGAYSGDGEMHVDMGNQGHQYFVFDKQESGYYHIRAIASDANYGSSMDGYANKGWGWKGSGNSPTNAVYATLDVNNEAYSCNWEFVSTSALTTYSPILSYAEVRAKVLALVNATDLYTDANNAVATLRAGVYAQDDVVDAATTAEEVNAATEAIKALVLPFVSSVTIKDGKSFDITDFVLTNPGFEAGNLNGWTNTGMQTQSNNSFEKTGTYYAEAWQPNGTKSITQEMKSLPAGYYTLSAKIKARTLSSARIYAGDAETSVTIADATNPYSVVFNCAANANVTVGLEGVGTGAGASWFALDGITVTYLGTAPLVLFQNELADAVAAARSHASGLVIPAAALTAYNNAIDAAAADNSSIAACQNSIAAIETATATADALVAPYATFNIAADNATFAGVASATISEQNTAVEAATTASVIENAIVVLQAATDALAIDITSFTITNPSAQTKEGWEGDDFGTASDGVCEYWSASGAGFHQTLKDLPAGDYRLTVVALQRTNQIGTVYAGENTTIIAQVPRSTANDRAGAARWFNAGNGKNYVNFTLDAASNVTIGLTADATTDDHWTVWQSFKLETFTETAAASYLKPGYDDAMAAAVAYQTVDMFDADKTALNNAITDNTVEEASATIAAYETAITNLNAATAAAATAAANYTTYNNIVAAIGENTNVDLTSFVTNAGFETGTMEGWTSVDGGSQANNKNFGRMSGEHFVERWKNGVALGDGSLTHDVIYLPAGLYRISADAQNIEQYNSNAGGKGLFLYANEENTEIGASANYSVYIKVADKTPLTIKFVLDNCTGNWISYDNVTLTYVDEDYVYALVDGKMNATVAAAQTDAETAFTGNQNGETYQALMDAIAAAQASKDAYATAATAIANANALKEAHNFATSEAITTFADAIAAIETPYNEGTLADADAANAGLTLGTLVTGWHAAADAAAVNFMENAFGLNDFDAALYVNTWSEEGETDGSNFKVPFYEYFAGDGNSLSANTWTATLTGMENGLYRVSAWVRVRTKNVETAVADLTGITMDVNGGTAVDVTEGDRVGESRFQLKEYTAEGLVKDGTLNVNFNIAEENNIHWLSFKNIKYTKVRDLNAEEMAVVPTAIALFNGEDEVTEPIALDKTNNSVTLTPSYTPADATEGYINWTSSDESVATVSSLGEVTAVLPGTATITATSTLDNTVSGTATVTVTYPESDYATSTIINEGATRTVTTLGENLIKNGSFEYPNALYGWTAKNTYTEAANASNFTITANGGVNDGAYVTTNAGGGGAATSLSRAIPVEAGKKYYFAVYTSGKAPTSANLQYNALFKLKNDKSEDGKLKEFEWPQGANNTTSEWSKTEYVFTADADHPYVGVRMSWNANSSFDNFVLAEITSEETIGNVQYALDAIPTENIGEGAFQYSQNAIDDANALEQGTATVAEVEAAYEALTTLNAPEETQAYNLVFNCDGHSADGNALTLIPNPAQTQGLYGLKYLAPANVNLAQAFYFVHTTGNKYKIYAIDTDLNERYITTQAEGYGTTWYDGIRTIDDASKAMEIEIRPNGEGLYLLWNTGANKPLAHNGNTNNDLFTNNTANFQLVETSKPTISINTTAAGWGTVMLPFAVTSLPEGVTAYTVSELEGKNNDVLTLDEANALEANKPYIIEGAWEETLTGDAQGAALTYEDGLLTGTYVKIAAPNESYILQKQGDIVGFYQVNTEEAQPNVPANRAYLTVDAAGVKAFYLSGTEDAIKSVFDAVANGDIYDLNGRKVQKMQKGNAYIVNGKKVIIK